MDIYSHPFYLLVCQLTIVCFYFQAIFIGSNCTGISVIVTELIALQRVTEGLLFDTEVVAGCNNFGHAPVGKVT